MYNGFRLPFDPKDIKTESGRSIEEAASSEMLVAPDGSRALGRIVEPLGNNGEFPAGEIQANAGAIQRAERVHGEDIRKFHYDDAKTMLLDVLANYKEIRQGDGKALLLSVQGSANHSAKAVVKLVEGAQGIYVVKDVGIVGTDYLKNKPLLYPRGGIPGTGPDTGMAYPNGRAQGQGAPESYARQQNSLETSLTQDGVGVNDGALAARGYTRFEPEITGEAGDIIQAAQTIIGLLEDADASTLPHELGHVFLDQLRQLAQMEGVSPEVIQNWETLRDWLHLRDIDFSKPLSEKDKARWRDAHEKMAAGFEKYTMTGKAPNSRLKRAFEAFKEWLTKIYQSIKNIVWRGADGKEHKFDLPKEAQEVFDRIMTPPSWREGGQTVSDITKAANERIEADLPPKPDARRMGIVAPGFDIDPATDPDVQAADPDPRFTDKETEERYKAASSGVSPDARRPGLIGAVQDFMFGFKGDFPLLAGKKELIPARETLRRLGREQGVAVQNAITTLRDATKGLKPDDFDLFGRKRLLDDLMWRKKHLPDAELPFGFTKDSLAAEHERITKLVEGNERVKAAIEAEEKTIKQINARMVELAGKLGWKELRDRFKNPHYFRHQVLDYAKMLDRGYLERYKGSKRDINADYIQANGDVRATQMRDIRMMQALVELKERYDISERLRADKEAIPEGYVRWTPFGRGILPSVETLTEQALDAALMRGGQSMGLSREAILKMMDDAQDSVTKSTMWVIPAELATTLDQMSAKKDQTPAGRAVKAITSGWKSLVLYSPTRILSYNIRNITGDMDAFMAGNPRGLAYVPRAWSDLADIYFRGRAATGELHEFQQRGGGLTHEAVQELYDWRQKREFAHLMKEMEGKSVKDWARLDKKAWGVIDKYWQGAEHLTDFREQILRYATYLSYLEQMQKDPEGRPANWGASDPDEVMAVEDIRDRAFKMANELLGAYDQVSHTGQQLRDKMFPFFSWLEVNPKRYYHLLKNGFTSDAVGDFAARLMKGMAFKSPLYAYRAAKTVLMVNLLGWAIQAFNHFVMGDDEEELTPDVRDRPHITLGHDGDGRVFYFDRVGAIGDLLDWFAMDSFWPDMREILNGQQTVTGYLKKMAQAPISKAVNALNPLLKTPAELLSGRSVFPDAFHPRAIRDVGTYVASTLGLSWEYRALTGQPGPKYFSMDRALGLFTYSQDKGEAAYFYINDKKREFQERVLGKSFDGFATSKRGNALRRLKTSLRFNDEANIKRSLQQYYEAGGTKQGLKASLKSLDPLHGLSKAEQKQFMAWLTAEDRKFLARAYEWYRDMRRGK